MHINYRASSFDAVPPTRANDTDAGLDLYVPLGYNFDFEPGEKRKVNTNIQVAIPAGYVGLLAARSSLQKKDLMVANSVGIIDAGYRGDLIVVLWNFGNQRVSLLQGEKFAQLVLVPVITPIPVQVDLHDDEWNDSERGFGGFGSTGK